MESSLLGDRTSAQVSESVNAIDGVLVAVRGELYELTVLGVVLDAAESGWHVRLGFTSPKGARYVTFRLTRGVIERHQKREDAAKQVLLAATSWLRLPPVDRPGFLEIT